MNDGDPDLPPAGHERIPSSQFVLSNLFATRNLERVEREAMRFLEVNPEDVDAHYYLTLVMIDLDQHRRALEHLDLLLKWEPEELRSHVAAAQLFLKMPDHRRLRHHVREGLRIDPDNVLLFRTLAIADLRELKIEEAKRHISRARQINPNDARTIHLHTIIHGAGQDDASSALRKIEQYQLALRLDPGNAGIHNSMGDVYLDDLDDPATAEVHFREALRLAPGNRDFQKDLFTAIAKRSLIYRLFSVPSRTFVWLGRVGYAIRHQPWRLVFFVFGFKLVLGFCAWLAAVTLLFWPGCKVYEWLLVSEIQRGAGASVGELRAWYWARRWPVWVRFGLFLLVNAAIWGGLFALFGVPMGTGYSVVGVLAAIHLAIVSALWGTKRLAAARARRDAERRKRKVPPLPNPIDRRSRKTDSGQNGMSSS